MDNTDTQSICTDAPTLVGSTRNRLSDGVTIEQTSEVLAVPPNASASSHDDEAEPTVMDHDRSSMVTRSSTSTLLVESSRQPPAVTPAAAADSADGDDQEVLGLFGPESTTREEDLTIPWWSAILPSPSLNRSRGRSAFRRPARSAQTDVETLTPPSYSIATHRSNATPPMRRAGQSFLQRSFSSPRALTAPVLHTPSSSTVQTSPSMPLAQPERTASTSPPPMQEQTIFPEPPPLPEPYGLYTKCYCEENIYILAAHLDSICRQRNANERSWRWNVDVCVVSNANTTVALWQQRASNAPETGNLVIWDYHVFCIVTCSSAAEDDNSRPSRSDAITGGWTRESEVATRTSWVYDLDTTLPVPHPLTSFLTKTFRADRPHTVSAGFRPLFRVVTATDFLAHFASDRSHMILQRSREDREMEHAMRASVGFLFEPASPQYTSTPPRWPLIRGPLSETSNNLFDVYVEMDARQVEQDHRYGLIVSVDELMRGVGLASQRQEHAYRVSPPMDAGVRKLIDRLSGESGTPVATMPVESAATDRAADESQQQTSEPGYLIGVRRVYGHRPPPPPPGQDHIARIDFAGRGKRVTNPLFPAYMHATLQSRAATMEALTSSSNPVAVAQATAAPPASAG